MESKRVGNDLAHTYRGESADRRKTCPKMDIKEILCPGSQVIKRCSMEEEKGGINSPRQLVIVYLCELLIGFYGLLCGFLTPSYGFYALGYDLRSVTLRAVLGRIRARLDAPFDGDLPALVQILVAEVRRLPPCHDGKEVGVIVAICVLELALDGNLECASADSVLRRERFWFGAHVADDDYLVDRSFLLFNPYSRQIVLSAMIPASKWYFLKNSVLPMLCISM